MDQPGVEVRPITNIARHHDFNEVFYTDARCPKDNVLGGVNNGWAVGNTLLGFERRGVGATTAYLPYRNELDMFIEMAREHGKLDDPLVRQDIARFHSIVEIMRYRGYQALTRFLNGQAPGVGVVDRQAVLERVPQGDHRVGDEPGRAGRHGRFRRGEPWRHRHPGDGHREQRRQLDAPFFVARPGHDLRRHQRGAAQHRRRAGARPAQGTPQRLRHLEGKPGRLL